jgi:hypothetical protein
LGPTPTFRSRPDAASERQAQARRFADTIDTLWQMTKQVAAGDEWSSINAGADEFVRQ